MVDENYRFPEAPRGSIVDHVHRQLRRAILSGKFPLGYRMIETLLAAMLNVSRTPVREAISKLETEGLVQRLRGGGVAVADVDAKMEEVILLRQALEGAAVRLACQRATQEELAEIVIGVERATDAVASSNLDIRSHLDRDFHMSIARATHSRRLSALVEEFYEYSFGDFEPSLSQLELEDLQKQHLAIATALRNRDADKAEWLVREHLGRVHAIVDKNRIRPEKTNRASGA